MRIAFVLLTGTTLLAPAPAIAADELKFGKAPEWVVPQAVPAAPAKSADAPVALLLTDQQVRIEPGKTVTFAEFAMKIQKPDGLAAGNLSLPWNPATDTVTVNTLEIHRGDKVIDVLASGQKFTTMRREAGLEASTLDGRLTANIQPEGLQEGDTIVFATTIEHADPVLGKHVEENFAAWAGLPIGLAHVHLEWPASMPIRIQAKGNIPVQPMVHGDRRVVEISLKDVEPIVTPKNAPARFSVARFGEATDFASWNDVSGLMSPLFRKAEALAPAGPLHDEVEKIRSSTPDPKARAEKALQLVQDRVRYVALVMGQGSYVPADAETTWSRRFGDCKAKTALLLGILHSLGIEAEPLLVQSRIGDAIAERLPMVSYFDHVLVRSRIGGKTYYLDGTRTGDSSLDDIQVPDFGWALPVIANAKLVHLEPPALSQPHLERHVSVDASAGIYAPVSVTLDEIYRGDSAVQLNAAYAAATADQRDEQMRSDARGFLDTFSLGTTSIKFDKAKRELTLTIKGTAKLDWKGGWFYVPTSSIAFDPDFDRPPGALHDVPLAINHPRFVKDEANILLPAGLAARQKLSAPVHETVAGVEYTRDETMKGDVLTIDSSERSLVPEIPYKDALAAVPRLRALSREDVYLSSNVTYRATEKDLAALATASPVSAEDFIRRGNLYMDSARYGDAIADYSAALKIEPGNLPVLADRGMGYVWNQKFDEAEKDLAAVEARDPGNTEVLRARGLMAEFRDDCAKAIDLYTRSLAKDPGNTFTIGHRATCEATMSKNNEALADSEQALKSDPSWANLRIIRANIFMRGAKHDLVAAEADAMVRDNPKSDFAWVGAAKIYAAIGQRDRAMTAFDRALAIKPYSYIYLNRSSIRPSTDLSGRTADLDAAMKLDPEDPDVLSESARLASDKGDYKGALALLDRIKATDTNAFTQAQRAIILYKAGRTGEAQKLAQSARIAAKTPSMLNNLCWRKATAGVMLDTALQECEDAVKLGLGDAQYVDSLAMVLLKSGKLDDALAAYTRAIEKAPLAASYMGRAIIYARKGDSAHSQADLAKAKTLEADIEDRFVEYGLKL